jgi:hypothetical protein
MLTGRFGPQNTFIAWARSLGKDGAAARAFAQRMSEKLSSRPRKTGPAWEIVEEVAAAVVDPGDLPGELGRLALMWTAANNRRPNAVPPEKMVVDEEAGVHDGVEHDIERSHEREQYAWLAALVTADPQRAAESVTWIAPKPATASAVDRLVAAYLRACAALADLEPQQVLESARAAGVQLDGQRFADLVERGAIGDWEVVKAVTRLVGGAPERLCLQYATQRRQTVQRMSRPRPVPSPSGHRESVRRRGRRRMAAWSRGVSTVAALAFALAVLTVAGLHVMRGSVQRRPPNPSSIDAPEESPDRPTPPDGPPGRRRRRR